MVPNLLNSFIKFPSAAATVGSWVELGRTTLGGLASNVTVSGLADKPYLMILRSILPTGGSIDIDMRLNSDAGTNYARRWNGGTTDATAGSTTFLNSYNQGGATFPMFTVEYISNIQAEEKLVFGYLANVATAGSGTAPGRSLEFSKWANTADVINEVEMNEGRAGSYNTGTEIVVLGWSPADVHTTNFWEELASDQLGSAGDLLTSGTISAKKYLWVQYYFKATGGNAVDGITFNNSTGSDYAERRSFNGGADFTQINRTLFEPNGGAIISGNAAFVNLFIMNNSANEKLVIGHAVVQSTAGAANPPNRNVGVWKWDITGSQITEIDMDNAQPGSYDVGSFLKVWGSN